MQSIKVIRLLVLVISMSFLSSHTASAATMGESVAMTPVEFIRFATPDKDLSHIKKLSITGNGTASSPALWKALDRLKDSLTHLKISRMAGSGWVEDLVGIEWKNLTVVSLQSCQITNDEIQILAGSPNLSSLQILDLHNNPIGDNGATTLANATNMPRLQVLNLSGNRMGGAGATALASATNMMHLEVLNLSGNHIRDVGAIALGNARNMPYLEVLDLSSNLIGDAGAVALAKMTDLRVLDLSHNGIDDKGAIAFANTKNADLETLNLAHNKINDDGAAAFATALENPAAMPKLQQLVFEGNKMTDAASARLKESFDLNRRFPAIHAYVAARRKAIDAARKH